MYLEAHHRNIIARARAPEIATLLGRFEGMTHGTDGAPHEILCAELLPVLADEMMILTPEGDGDYRYLHYGRTLVRLIGKDHTDDVLSSLPPEVARFTASSYDRALAEGRPAYTVHRTLRTARVGIWERLILPTTAQDGRRHLVVFCRLMNFNEEFLATLLETSPSGILALQAQRDEADRSRIDGLTVVTANARAAQLCGLGEKPLAEEKAREVLPFLADEVVWQRCRYALELRRPDQFDVSFRVEGREIWLQVALALLGDGLVMTLTDITALMETNLALRDRAASLAFEIGVERATRRALSEEIGVREERERELRRLAETDPLTALLNRRSFVERAQQAIATSEVVGSHASLIIVDLDHFKRINDKYGHAAGDGVIRAVADLLLGTARDERDLVGRFGGEEFVLLLPRTGTNEARALATDMLRRLSARELPVSETLSLRVTASMGVATRLVGEGFSNWLDRADQALYRAKAEGRNRVSVSLSPRQEAA